MTIPVNDRDLFLYNASTRDVDPRNSKYLLLTPNTPIFRVNAAGTGFPSSIDITAQLVGLPSTATVNFTIGSGGTLTGTGLTRTLAFSSMSVDTVTINASVTDLGQTYTQACTISKVADGSSGTGTKGDTGNTIITAFLYKWSTVQPSLPTGTATCTTDAGKNTSYSGTDGWYVDPPANPGQAGLALYVAQKTISVPYGTATTSVTYTAGATVAAYSQNGANGGKGDAGVPGIKNTQVHAYRWAVGPAPTITGVAIYKWADNTYDTVPSGWSMTKPDAPSKGYTLYEATVGIVDTTGAATSGIDFGTAAVVGISYVALDGVGTPGATGNSVAIAYTLITGNTLAATPDTFVAQGKALPTTGTWGETQAWTPQPSVPAAGQSVFQSNGIYNGTNTTWGVPYLSSLRVGSLSTLTANLGAITAGSIDLGTGGSSWHVDSSGNQWIGSSTFGTAPFKVTNTGDATFNSVTIVDKASGNVILNAGGLKSGYEAPGTKNADLAPAIANAATTAVYDNVTNRPTDVSNLIKKGTFEDGLPGGWSAYAVEPIGGTNAGAVPALKQIVTQQRDCLENQNSFPVTPGETIYFSAWINTEATAYGAGIGFFGYDANFNIVQYAADDGLVMPGSFSQIGAGIAWTYVQGRVTVAAGVAIAVPWLRQTGFDYSGMQRARYAALWMGRAQRGATVGAPAGTLVGGTDAATVASNAAAGAAANGQIPGLSAGLADKLSKSANSTLTGTIALATQYALQVGTASDGIFIGNTGLYGRKGNATQFAIMADGSALFAGTLGAGIVTARTLLIGNPDNAITDPNFEDVSWWGRPGQSTPDYLNTSTPWKSRRTMIFGPNFTGGTAYADTFGQFFPTQAGGVYRLEFSVFLSSDFQGRCAAFVHMPGQEWCAMGAPNLGAFAEDGDTSSGIQFNGGSPKGFQTFSTIRQLGSTTYQTHCQIRLKIQCTAGYIEFGNFSMVRVSDTTLIQDGAVTAQKVSVVQLDALSARIGVLRTAVSGARTEIKDNLIAIYDGNNTRRIHLGDSSL